MVYMDINMSNTHADPLLGSRWAQMWVHMQVHTLVIILVYVTKGNIEDKLSSTTVDFIRSDGELKSVPYIGSKRFYKHAQNLWKTVWRS